MVKMVGWTRLRCERVSHVLRARVGRASDVALDCGVEDSVPVASTGLLHLLLLLLLLVLVLLSCLIRAGRAGRSGASALARRV